MKVFVGDELIIEGHRVGQARRVGRVVEVRGADGGPPYRVEWDDTGTTTLLFPGPDCFVHHLSEHDGSDTSAQKETV
jgi:hypothetical protein